MMISVSYNKTEDDFETLDEYNDYLEHVEDLSTFKTPFEKKIKN